MLNMAQVTQVNITKHARAQIRARGMDAQALARILETGKIRESKKIPGRFIIQAGSDSVIVAQAGGLLHILTAIRDGIQGAQAAA